LTPVLEAEALRERGLRACLGDRPVVMDVGFGRAELLLELAANDPERVYLGVEVSRKRVAKAARRVLRAELENLRLVHATAEFMVERVLPKDSIAECWINFSDPWPKKRHFKRRLSQRRVVDGLGRALAPGAILHVATDHAGYADWIAEVFERAPGLQNLHAPHACSRDRPERPITGYEAEWLAEGRIIAYFEYRKP